MCTSVVDQRFWSESARAHSDDAPAPAGGFSIPGVEPGRSFGDRQVFDPIEEILHVSGHVAIGDLERTRKLVRLNLGIDR